MINDGISEINKSSGSNSSNTSKQLIEALSSGTNVNLKNDNTNSNDNLSFSEDKKDENAFDMDDLFFIQDSIKV